MLDSRAPHTDEKRAPDAFSHRHSPIFGCHLPGGAAAMGAGGALIAGSEPNMFEIFPGALDGAFKKELAVDGLPR